MLCTNYVLYLFTQFHVGLFVTSRIVAHQAPLSMVFSRQKYWSGLPCPLPGDLPNPGIEPRSPALQVDSSPSEPPRKPKNTGVGNLFLLQEYFPTQESNWGLLHCRWILYQLRHQGSPHRLYVCTFYTSLLLFFIFQVFYYAINMNLLYFLYISLEHFTDYKLTEKFKLMPEDPH